MEMLKRICLTVTIGLLLLSLTSIGEPERAVPQYLLGNIKDLKVVEEAEKDDQIVAPGLGTVSQAKKGETYYLIANLKDAQGTVTTDIGVQQTSFGGEIAFQISTDDKGATVMNLQRLNLVSPGVQTKSGSSGVIGLNLISAPYKVNYDPRGGQISSEFESNLHYALIDEIT